MFLLTWAIRYRRQVATWFSILTRQGIRRGSFEYFHGYRRNRALLLRLITGPKLIRSFLSLFDTSC